MQEVFSKILQYGLTPNGAYVLYCIKFTTSHPASAVYNGSKWDSKGVFAHVQKTVKDLYNKTIHW